MKLGVRAKLFLVSVLLVLSGVIAVGLILEDELRSSRLDSIERELLRHVRSARTLIEESGTDDRIPAIDALADKVGAATDVRVTVIDAAGRVLGDSSLSPPEIAALDNHGKRPEVLAALATGTGMSRRYSTTVDAEMQYVAVGAGPSHPDWVIRVAKPLSEVDAAIARLRRQIILAGLIALLAAGLMSALASHWMVRALRELAETATAIASGEAGKRLEVASRDEIGHLAGSLNEMAESIENTVAALAAERGRFETVLEAMSDAVIALDDKRRITLVNGAAREMLGLDDSPVGRVLVDVLRVPALQERIAGGGDGTAEFELPNPERRVLARVTALRGGGGRVIVMQDVSTVRRLETIRQDFVANVSHELRTPVSVVKANAETLLDGALEDERHARPLLEGLHRSAERMSRLIGDLLDLSRLEAGRHDLRAEPVDVAVAAARAAEAVDGAAKKKGTHVTIDAARDVSVRADAKALDQVLINLLDNAVKHAGDNASVQLSATTDADVVRIEVADDGPGIPTPDRERVFERFYRIDPGRSRDMGGTGLGLSIVKHLTEAMNGRVGVAARDPRGAVFWVELPRAA